ncbi:unnamed protein product [Protopolystoma xenopodis]|uniref:Uncharacterized protein n=1 Tax=Protopolystoma xenopodis TaxID=117903 RepID=A0A3S5CGG1_9PLAT|nr:unnamed protein product [Protopolystoma xenopodis]
MLSTSDSLSCLATDTAILRTRLPPATKDLKAHEQSSPFLPSAGAEARSPIWSFSRLPITQSLVRHSSWSTERRAIKLFTQLLRIAQSAHSSTRLQWQTSTVSAAVTPTIATSGHAFGSAASRTCGGSDTTWLQGGERNEAVLTMTAAVTMGNVAPDVAGFAETEPFAPRVYSLTGGSAMAGSANLSSAPLGGRGRWPKQVAHTKPLGLSETSSDEVGVEQEDCRPRVGINLGIRK